MQENGDNIQIKNEKISWKIYYNSFNDIFFLVNTYFSFLFYFLINFYYLETN